MAILIVGCSNSDDTRYVGEGDLYFDDAISRLSPSERKRLEDNGPDKIRGFAFSGERKTCIVIFSIKEGLVTHAPDPAYCYDNNSNQFVEKL